MADVFISCSPKDIEWVEVLARHLESDFFSIEWGEKPGSEKDFCGGLNKSLVNAKVVIIVWSGNSCKSDCVNAEYEFSSANNKERLSVFYKFVDLNAHHDPERVFDMSSWNLEKNDAAYVNLRKSLTEKIKSETLISNNIAPKEKPDRFFKNETDLVSQEEELPNKGSSKNSGSIINIETVFLESREREYSVKVVLPHASLSLEELEFTLQKQRIIIDSSQSKMEQAFVEQTYMLKPLEIVNFYSPTIDAIMAHSLIQILIPMINSRGGNASYAKLESFSLAQRIEIMRSIAERMPPVKEVPVEKELSPNMITFIFVMFTCFLALFAMVVGEG